MDSIALCIHGAFDNFCARNVAMPGPFRQACNSAAWSRVAAIRQEDSKWQAKDSPSALDPYQLSAPSQTQQEDSKRASYKHLHEGAIIHRFL